MALRETVTTQQALDAVRAGEFLIVVDDASATGGGDLILAAQHADASHVNFMLMHARGTLCVALTEERLATATPPRTARPRSGC